MTIEIPDNTVLFLQGFFVGMLICAILIAYIAVGLA